MLSLCGLEMINGWDQRHNHRDLVIILCNVATDLNLILCAGNRCPVALRKLVSSTVHRACFSRYMNK